VNHSLKNQYAGFWIRALAMIIDSLICVIPVLIFQSFVPVLGGVLVTFMYRPFFESSALMATPGKALLGLRVTNLELQRISFGIALIRMLMSYVSGLILFIGYLMAVVTSRKQTLHDLVANTIVTYGPHPTKNYLEAWTDQVEAVFTSGFGKTKTTQEKVPDISEAPPQTLACEDSDLEKLQKLFEQELITAEEFENLKNKYSKNL
jgi:uncharacterized RDD family membrane protein YckC